MCHLWFSHFAQKNFTHSFWLNLMMAAILNSSMLDSDSAILDSDTLLSSLRFTQKHSHSTLNLTPTNSIWLIWDVSHLEFCHLGLSHFEQKKLHSFILTQLHDGSHLEFYHLGFSYFSWKNFTHSFWLNLMMAAILKLLPCWIQTLPSWIQTPCYLLSDSLKNTLTPLRLWLKLIQSDSNSFILT